MREAFPEAGELRIDFAFFQNYIYDKKDFDLQLHNIFMTLDLVLSVILLVEAQFYSYDTPRDFFEVLGDLNSDFSDKIKPLSKRFVLLNKMLFE